MNEIDPFAQRPVLEPYRSRLEAMYRAWAAERALPLPSSSETVDFARPAPQVASFIWM